jgi:hypothetical protein
MFSKLNPSLSDSLDSYSCPGIMEGQEKWEYFLNCWQVRIALKKNIFLETTKYHRGGLREGETGVRVFVSFKRAERFYDL